MERGSGILLHISSLPSKHGIGTFGKEARNFVKILQYLWNFSQKYDIMNGKLYSGISII